MFLDEMLKEKQVFHMEGYYNAVNVNGEHGEAIYGNIKKM